MKKLDLNFIKSNNNVFINLKKEIIITFYVDDVLIIDRNKIVIKRIKNTLNVKFHILNLKSYVFYLNIIIKKNHRNDIIHLKQKIYITRFLNYFKC